jgi:hypothetical protein
VEEHWFYLRPDADGLSFQLLWTDFSTEAFLVVGKLPPNSPVLSARSHIPG